eukprot:CAMPEP_0114556556 /NCGR_PEP_ID=MMETSP0114-20121206/9353_1 /TAXON_ID=31324 /ORGANISM="Goniomonas sp, Strain m" /LENGTH=392 /DNA_ID=CAMNT_0001741771 /DNA_START=23 /DNA_END=1201 /DNA_ORIENTATION=-
MTQPSWRRTAPRGRSVSGPQMNSCPGASNVSLASQHAWEAPEAIAAPESPDRMRGRAGCPTCSHTDETQCSDGLCLGCCERSDARDHHSCLQWSSFHKAGLAEELAPLPLCARRGCPLAGSLNCEHLRCASCCSRKHRGCSEHAAQQPPVSPSLSPSWSCSSSMSSFDSSISLASTLRTPLAASDVLSKLSVSQSKARAPPKQQEKKQRKAKRPSPFVLREAEMCTELLAKVEHAAQLLGVSTGHSPISVTRRPDAGPPDLPAAWTVLRMLALSHLQTAPARTADDIRSLLRAYAAAGGSLDIRDGNGRTTLWVACSTGGHSVVEALLDAGAGMDVAANDGSTPWSAAVDRGNSDVLAVIAAWRRVEASHGGEGVCVDLALCSQLSGLSMGS